MNASETRLATILNLLVFGVLAFLSPLQKAHASLAPRIDTSYFMASKEAYERTLFQEKDMEKMVPLNLSEEMSDTQLTSKIADRSLQNYLKSPRVQASSLGRTSKSIEKATRVDMSLGGNTKDSIEHKFRFQMLAFQSEAQLKYSGLLNAELKYEIARSQVDVEIKEPLAQNKELVFNYQSSHEDTLNQVLLRLNF